MVNLLSGRHLLPLAAKTAEQWESLGLGAGVAAGGEGNDSPSPALSSEDATAAEPYYSPALIRRREQVRISRCHAAAVFHIGDRVRDAEGRVGTVTHERIIVSDCPIPGHALPDYQRIEVTPDPGQGCTFIEAASRFFTPEKEA